MNPIAIAEKSFAKQPISPALRCARAIDEIDPSDYGWGDDEVALLVRFSGIIGTDKPIYGID